MTNDYHLGKGPHTHPSEGRCAMEWVAYLAGEEHTDQPACVSPILAAFCISFNDILDVETRQRLRPYLARTIGTACDGMTSQRADMCFEWLATVHVPAWLDLVPLPLLRGHAQALRDTQGKDLPLVRGLIHELSGVMDMVRRNTQAKVSSVGPIWSDSFDQDLQSRYNAAREGATFSGAPARVALKSQPLNRDLSPVITMAEVASDAACAAVTYSPNQILSTFDFLQKSMFDLLDRMLPTELIQLPVVDDYKAFLPVD